MKVIKITAKPGASRRTKNRVKIHGPLFVRAQSFIDGKHVDSPWRVHPCLGGKKSVHVDACPDGLLDISDGFSGPGPSDNRWGGWFPVDEVEIEVALEVVS